MYLEQKIEHIIFYARADRVHHAINPTSLSSQIVYIIFIRARCGWYYYSHIVLFLLFYTSLHLPLYHHHHLLVHHHPRNNNYINQFMTPVRLCVFVSFILFELVEEANDEVVVASQRQQEAVSDTVDEWMDQQRYGIIS